MKKSTKKRISRLTALVLTLLMLALPLFSVFADGTTIPARVGGIYDDQVYMLKNKASGLYLTLPDYTETGRNVYQYSKRVNDQYSRAVTITYSPTNGLYTINALIYEDFGGGRVTFDVDGNVYLSQDSNGGSGEWRFCYNGEQQGFRILNQNLEAITSSFGHGSASQDIGSAGNIYVSSEQLGNYQIWELEAVTVNPHLVKATTTIEKKNIGNANEWLFRLRDAELDTRTIESVEVVMNPEIVTVVFNTNFNTKGFIVRVTEANDVENDPHEKYSLIKVTLNGNEIRYVMVQDAGTGSNDACKTVPIYKYSRYSTVTIPENGTKDYMVTLTSEIGGKPVKRWEISDDWVITTKTHNGKLLSGTSYIVVKARNIGFSLISAYIDHDSDSSTEDIAYSVLVEVRQETTGGQLVHPYVIELESTTDTIELGYSRQYLIKMPFFVNTNVIEEGEDLSDVWRLDYNNTLSLVFAGHNYAVIQTESKEFFETDAVVTPDRYYHNGVTATLTYGMLDIDFTFAKSRKYYIDDGIYYLQNSEYEVLFMESTGLNSDDVVDLGTFEGDTTQQWLFSYLGNGYYSIALADSVQTNADGSIESAYWLTLQTDNISSGSTQIGVSLSNTDNISYASQWQITYNQGLGYNIRNRVTLENQSTRFYSVTGVYMIVNMAQFDYIYNRAPQDDASDEWLILSAYLPEEFATEFLGGNITGYTVDIGYWNKKDIKISVEIDESYEAYMNDGHPTDEDIHTVIQNSINKANNVLGLNIEFVARNEEADINILFSTQTVFEAIYGEIGVVCVGVATDYELTPKHRKIYNDTQIQIFEYSHAQIGIFIDSNFLGELENVISHELCHALGYGGHSTQTSTLMYPSVQPPSFPDFQWPSLNSNDASILCTVYKECHLDE